MVIGGCMVLVDRGDENMEQYRLTITFFEGLSAETTVHRIKCDQCDVHNKIDEYMSSRTKSVRKVTISKV